MSERSSALNELSRRGPHERFLGFGLEGYAFSRIARGYDVNWLAVEMVKQAGAACVSSNPRHWEWRSMSSS